MKCKLLSLALVLVFILNIFCSCGGVAPNKPAMSIDSANGSNNSSNADVVFSFENVSISQGLYRYIYNEYKTLYLELCNSLVAQNGYLSQTNDIIVEDTEAFWSATVPADVHSTFEYLKSNYYGYYSFDITDEDLGSYTYADVVLDHANSECKEYLIYTALAKQYDYVPSRDFEDYNDGLEAAIAQNATGADCFEGIDSISDKNGVLYDWAKARWEVNLAGRGITKEEWVSAYYEFPILTTYLAPHIVEKNYSSLGEDDDDLAIVNYYLEQVNASQVAFEYIRYDLLSEENYNAQKEQQSEESAEVFTSEDDNDISLDEVSDEGLSLEDSDDEESLEEVPPTDPLANDADTYEEYVEIRKQACQDIYDSIVNGEIEFDTAREASPYYEEPDEGYTSVVYLDNSAFKQYFEKSADEVKVGDIELFVQEKIGTIWILKYTDWTVNDLTEKEIAEIIKNYAETYVGSLKSQKVNAIFDKAYDCIKVGSISDDYKKPWNID